MNFSEFTQMLCNVAIPLQPTEQIQNLKSVFAVCGLAISLGEVILPVLPLAKAPSDLATMRHATVTWTSRSRVSKADEMSIGSTACQFSMAFAFLSFLLLALLRFLSFALSRAFLAFAPFPELPEFERSYHVLGACCDFAGQWTT